MFEGCAEKWSKNVGLIFEVNSHDLVHSILPEAPPQTQASCLCKKWGGGAPAPEWHPSRHVNLHICFLFLSPSLFSPFFASFFFSLFFPFPFFGTPLLTSGGGGVGPPNHSRIRPCRNNLIQKAGIIDFVTKSRKYLDFLVLLTK